MLPLQKAQAGCRRWDAPFPTEANRHGKKPDLLPLQPVLPLLLFCRRRRRYNHCMYRVIAVTLTRDSSFPVALSPTRVSENGSSNDANNKRHPPLEEPHAPLLSVVQLIHLLVHHSSINMHATTINAFFYGEHTFRHDGSGSSLLRTRHEVIAAGTTDCELITHCPLRSNRQSILSTRLVRIVVVAYCTRRFFVGIFTVTANGH